MNLVLGENGIVTKAKDAREQTIIGHEKEQINLAYSACKTRENFDDLVTANELETEMKKSNENVSVAADGDNLVITFEETKHQYNIGQDGSFSDIVDWSKLGPGLYKTGTSEMIKSWQELIDDGEVTVKDGVLDTDRIKIEEKGDLVISSSVNEIISFYKGCGGYSDYNVIGLYIPKSVNSIGDFAGEKFLALEKLVISDGCKSIGNCAFRMVYYNVESKLSTIEIPDSIEKMGYDVFEDTKWLNDQPDGEVYIGKVFYKYKGKMPENTNIDIKSGTRAIAGLAFTNGSELCNISLPESIKGVGPLAFRGCSKLNQIELPNSIENIEERAFSGCTSLNSINIPESLKVINYGIIEDCKNIVSIDIPKNVNEIDPTAFYGCDSLQRISVEEENTTFSSVDGILFNKDKTSILLYRNRDSNTYNIPSTVKVIGKMAFIGCNNLKNISIPEGVNEIGEKAFMNTEITEIKIPQNVKTIGNSAFEECRNLKNIEIPDNVITIGNSTFHYCTQLKSVKISNNITIIGVYTFAGCYSLTNVEIPSGVTEINYGAFEGCRGLESINIPKSVTSLGNEVFRSCTKVKVTVASGTSLTASDLSKAGLSSSQYTFE